MAEDRRHGATGRLGGRVGRLLAERGLAQRLAVSRPDRAPELAGAVAVRCADGEPEQVEAFLEGVETVLMVSGSETPDRVEQHRTFIDTAAAAGVQRLVYHLLRHTAIADGELEGVTDDFSRLRPPGSFTGRRPRRTALSALSNDGGKRRGVPHRGGTPLVDSSSCPASAPPAS